MEGVQRILHSVSRILEGMHIILEGYVEYSSRLHFDLDPTHTAFCRRMRTALALEGFTTLAKL